MAKRFSDEFGMVRLSMGEAVRMVLETQQKTRLGGMVKAHLWKGMVLPDELAVQCLEVALMDMRCQTRGSVFDLKE